MMKIAVCLKQVPDTETKIKLKPDKSGIDPAAVKWIVNPYDEHAIEEGIKLRDAHPGSQVFAFTCGPKSRALDSLRTALAMGCDEAVCIDSPQHTDNSITAAALVAALEKDGPFDLVLTGKLAIDDNSASVSQMLAEGLKIPHATVVSKLAVTASSLTAERETEGGTKEILDLTLPALVAANKGLNTPRYASLPGIMKAKKKVIKDYDLGTFGLDAGKNKVNYSNYELPPDKPSVKMLSGSAAEQSKQLAGLLRDEAKVL